LRHTILGTKNSKSITRSYIGVWLRRLTSLLTVTVDEKFGVYVTEEPKNEELK
jgi:hypothetical protein